MTEYQTSQSTQSNPNINPFHNRKNNQQIDIRNIYRIFTLVRDVMTSWTFY
jgi:hypothetical protein